MATSGVITSNLTAGGVIVQAMQLIGKLAPGDDISADEEAVGLQMLNFMLKSWQADGCNIWRQEPTTLAWDAGVQTMTLDPRVIDVVEARWLQTTNFERPLARWELGEYVNIPNKNAAGSPTAFYFDKNRDSVTITLWMVPETASSLLFTAARVIEDVTATADNLDIPQEWTETAYFCLADRFIDAMAPASLDSLTAERVSGRAAQLYEKLSGLDRPSAMFFRPWGKTW